MPCSSFPRLGFVVEGVMLALTQGGCTVEMWKMATLDTRSYGGIPGMIHVSSQGGAQLVLRYDGPGESHVLLPLDDHGAPPPLFLYTGKRNTVDSIAADISPQRLAAIRDYVFDENSKAAARRAMNSAGYKAFTYSHDVAYYSYWNYAPHMDLVLVALGPDGVPQMGKEIKKRDGQPDYLFPDDCRIIILPHLQPLTPGELHTSKALAVILTPLTVASDIVLIPIAFIVRFATGDMC